MAETLARSRSFVYRGVDLQCAFKRAVYFELINDAQAYEVFRAEQRGARPAPQPAGSSAAREILAAYLSAPEPVRAVRPPMRERLLNVARGAAASMLHPVRSEPLWALAIQPKFVAHLQPVLDALDEPYRIVTFDDPLTDDYARERGYLSLNAGAAHERMRLGALPNDIGVVRNLAIAYDAVFRHLFRDPPKGVLLSEGNAPIYEIVNLAAHKLRIPTVCLQQGWSPIVHSGFRDLHFSSMIVWGDWFAEALAPHNPGQKFCALGNHLIALSGTKALPARTVGFFLQRGSRLISGEAWAGMLDLVEFCARELPQARVIVREHPNGPLTGEERTRLRAFSTVELMPPGEVPLESVLALCDVVVSIFSTTILEGIGAGATPVIVNATSMPSYYPDLAGEGAGIEVKDFAAARDALRMLWSEGTARYAPRIAAMQRRLFAHGGSGALERIVAHLRSEFGLVPSDAAQR